MARFKGNAHDVYEQNATFTYEDTLSKEVGQWSEHFHKNDLSWTSDAKITFKAPNITETYDSVIRRKNVSLYFYPIFKTSFSPLNFSNYWYSKNKSAYYTNFSGSTSNTGVFFILPSPNRLNDGKKQWNIGLLDKKRRDVISDIKLGKKKRVCLLFVKDVPTNIKTGP